MADWDEVEGKVKEKGGEVTGDRGLEAEGEAQGAWGGLKDSAGDAKDAAEDKLEDLKD